MFERRITPQRCKKCLHRLANGKAPGPDNIPAEILKAMPAPFHEALTLLFHGMALEGYTPSDWITNRTCLIFKKGDPTLLDNYRPIALAPTIHKLWTSIVTDIASNFVENTKSSAPMQKASAMAALAPEPHSSCSSFSNMLTTPAKTSTSTT